jgi:hypothetical protein
MNQLRRRNDLCLGTPVSAEVLEVRALLSAGAAAVHQAQHAAALHAAAVTPLASHPSGSANFFLSPTGTGLIPGQFTTLKPGHSVGDSVTFKFQGIVTEGPSSVSFKASFTGKVANVSGPAGDETFSVTPGGGSFAVTFKQKGTPTQKVSGTIDPAQFTYVDSSGAVSTVHVVFDQSPKNHAPYNSGAAAVNLLVT